jgi:hypothetical protein
MDHGCRWVSSLFPDSQESPLPAKLAADLYEIPAVSIWPGFQEPTSDSANSSDKVLERLYVQTEAAAQADRILTLAFPLARLASLDGWEELIGKILKRAGDLGLPLITLNEAADVTLAHCQAEGPARSRVSVQQHLHFRQYWDTVIGPGQQAYKVYDYRGGWRLKPGCYRRTERGWETLPEPDPQAGFQINQHGLRGPMAPHHKPPGEKRVLILGDSCVFGVAGDEAPWPAQVQRYLQKLAGPVQVQVLNAGIEGQSSVHCLMRLERLLTFEPDVLLLAVAANDLFIEDPASYVDTTGQDYATSWELVGEYPRQQDILKTAGGVRRPMNLDDFYPYSYDDHLRRIARRCRRQGVLPALMTLPCLIPADLRLAGEGHRQKMHHPPFVLSGDMQSMRRLYDIYNGAVRRVAREEQASLIEGEEFIAAHFDDCRDTLFSDTCHPTPEGNRYLGRFAAAQLWAALTENQPRSSDIPG